MSKISKLTKNILEKKKKQKKPILKISRKLSEKI
jgi:hypothetical protein